MLSIMNISKQQFGELAGGEKVTLWTLESEALRFSLLDFGACWTSLIVPSRQGSSDILLGYTMFKDYIKNPPFFGQTIGRFSNRIGGACFTLDGKTFSLEKNDGSNTLHSGSRAFGFRLWSAEADRERGGVFVRFTLHSADGEGGFPGNLIATVIYGITEDNKITADYSAVVDAPSPVSLTNHAYFNLAGGGDVLNHEVKLSASRFLEIDGALIPTGKILPVENTPFDFTKRKKIKTNLPANGYDHCFIVDGDAGLLRPVAEVYEPSTGRVMKVSSTQPCLQFYTGGFLSGVAGKPGAYGALRKNRPFQSEGRMKGAIGAARYDKFSGFCLETQHYPDSPNKPGFPPSICRPDLPYHERAEFEFC
jgi:aldose 1-epimerase